LQPKPASVYFGAARIIFTMLNGPLAIDVRERYLPLA